MSNRDPPAKKVILRIPLLLTVVSRSRCDATFVPLESCRHSEPVYINFDISKIFSSSGALSQRAAAQDNAVTRVRFGGKCVTLAKSLAACDPDGNDGKEDNVRARRSLEPYLRSLLGSV